jgi:hypothetical protein
MIFFGMSFHPIHRIDEEATVVVSASLDPASEACEMTKERVNLVNQRRKNL